MGKSTSAVLFAAFILVAAASLGCKGKGGTLTLDVANQGSNSNKPLMSLWVESRGLYTLDLRSATFGSPSSIVITAVTGQVCTCQATIQGGETTGNIAISSCAGAAQCASYNGSGTYTRSGANLSVCDTVNGCTSLN